MPCNNYSAIENALGEFFPDGFLLFGVDSQTGLPVLMSEFGNATVSLGIHLYAEECLKMKREELKKLLSGGEGEQEES